MTEHDSFSRLAFFTSARLARDETIAATVAEHLGDRSLPGRCWVSSERAPGEWRLLAPDTGEPTDDHDRFVIDEERCRALIERGGAEPEHVPTCITVDLTVSERSDEIADLILKVGAWTQWPSSRWLGPGVDGPNGCPERTPGGDRLDSARSWRAAEVGPLLDGDYFVAADAVLTLLVGDKRVFQPLVLGRRYLPPRMYLACPSGSAPGWGDEWFSPDWQPIWSAITDSVLAVSDRRDARIAGSIQARTGTLTVFRAMLTDAASLPNVLFLPAGSYDEATFEDEVTELGRFLDRFELRVIHELAEGINELEMNIDRVRDYELVGQQAAVIVNPLLLALAGSTRDHLQRVQSAVDLVRVTLLQSGPELIELQGRITGRRERVEDLRRNARSNRLDFGERAPEGMAHVDEALVASGSFEELDRATRVAVDVLEGLSPIRAMIENTASILADRREQAVARLTNTAHKLNLVLLVLAAATTTDLLVHFNWEQTYRWVSPALRTSVVAAMLGTVAWYVWVRARRGVARHIGGIDPWAVRERIIAHLQRNALADDFPAPADFSWDTFDRAQAGELAEIVSEVETIQATLSDWAASVFARGQAQSTSQLDYFIGRAEHWALVALLVAERPFPYPRTMPRTAMLFHLAWGGQFVSPAELEHVLAPWVGYAAVDSVRREGLARRAEGSSIDELLRYVDDAISEPSDALS